MVLANTGLWVALSVSGIVWVSMALVVFAAFVVGGRVERMLQEELSKGQGRPRTYEPTCTDAVGTANEPLVGAGRVLNGSSQTALL